MAKVFIDIGHGSPSKNGGATYGKRTESADVIRLSHRVGELLKSQGIEVRYSRTDDADPDLVDRCRDANKWEADYFVSIHRNAFKPNSAKGVEAYIYSKATKGGDAYNKAKKLVDALVSVGFTDRSVKIGYPGNANGDYTVNKYSEMTSCLLEVGFVDSDADNKIFDEKFNEMALALAKALCSIVGKTYTEPKPEPTEQNFIVVVGGAMDKQHAEWVAERLRKNGETAYITLIGDIDGDGRVTTADAREILNKAVGK